MFTSGESGYLSPSLNHMRIQVTALNYLTLSLGGLIIVTKGSDDRALDGKCCHRLGESLSYSVFSLARASTVAMASASNTATQPPKATAMPVKALADCSGHSAAEGPCEVGADMRGRGAVRERAGPPADP